ncbi:MAG: DUF1295 domain-containing protein [Gammaproteobacteria bacterium]|nr:DUF1295 domain-containing protein [Gammaproteobacteria bacterium]MDE0367662.1 DUF1295 domain-containing protein [Gammaproteobacteria bacterium]
MPDLNIISHPLTGTPFGAALDLCLILAALVWLMTAVTRECSWVDRLWSVTPPVYCLLVAAAAGFDSARLNIMAALVTLWGARLTFNFARKGGYWSGGEDYRWPYVRERLSPVQFQLVNLFFISFPQMLIIWLFASPIHQAWVWLDAPLNWLDAVAAILFLVLLLGETVADEQMWAFQQDKQRKIDAGEPVEQPFLRTGLYTLSRHPNYFCEIGMWWVFYLFAVAASGEWLHWTGLGFVLLTALMISSARFGESISLGKYPAYSEYQATTPHLIPLPGFMRGKG